MRIEYQQLFNALTGFVFFVLFIGTVFYYRTPSPSPHRNTGIPHGVLNVTGIEPGVAIKPGTKLRILPLGDSITQGWLSEKDGGDGNGYRLQLREDLSEDEVVYAGTSRKGDMYDGYFAAWPGRTIAFIGEHMKKSVAQRPNLILVHAGTNDMDDRPDRGREGNEPQAAAERLGELIDLLVEACPDAVILVAVIIGTCDEHKAPTTPEYQSLIPATVQKRRDEGHHVLAVDFSTFPMDHLRDCIHPTNEGYKEFGDYWYDFITQIPSDWIQEPVGDDPVREQRTRRMD